MNVILWLKIKLHDPALLAFYIMTFLYANLVSRPLTFALLLRYYNKEPFTELMGKKEIEEGTQ